jgi:hypothetical protein
MEFKMKKCKTFVSVCAALLIVLFSSCSTQEDENKIDLSSEVSSVRIKIVRNSSPATRQGVEPGSQVGDGTHLEIGGGGHLFFVNSSGVITKYVQILSSNSGAGNGESTVEFNDIDALNYSLTDNEGVIENVPSSSTKVYIFLNLPNTLTITGSTLVGFPITNLDAHLISAVDLADPTGGFGVAKVPVSGWGNLVASTPGAQTPTHSIPYDFEAEFDLKAIAARIEITGFTTVPASSNPNLTIQSFDLTGIYITNYYPTVTLAGGAYATKKDAGSDTLHYTPNIGNANLAFFYTSANYGEYLHTIDNASVTTGFGTFVSGPPAASVSAGSTNVWGYNIFPNDTLAVSAADLAALRVRDNLPHIVLRLSNVVIHDAGDGQTYERSGSQFVTVKGYTSATAIGDQSAGSLAYLERGYIYQLSATAGFEISPDDLSSEPETTEVNALVTATLIDWRKVTVEPELQ